MSWIDPSYQKPKSDSPKFTILNDRQRRGQGKPYASLHLPVQHNTGRAMSNELNDHYSLAGPDRRDILHAAGTAIAGATAAALAMGSPALAQTPGGGSPRAATGDRNSASLGARLQGVQHFGLTVQNMDRAFAFYTEVLGGTEMMRDGDFQGERIHNTLLTDQDIEARAREVNPRTMGIPDLRGGAQRLDVRFIQFDNVVIELLQYRDADQPAGSGGELRRAAAIT